MSFLAPLLAFTAFNAFLFPYAFFAEDSSGWWVGPALVAPFAAGFSLVIWIVVIVPFSLLVLPCSLLWCWPVRTACGAVACIVLAVSWTGISHPMGSRYLLWSLAAIMGGTTCLFASVTQWRFRFARTT